MAEQDPPKAPLTTTVANAVLDTLGTAVHERYLLTASCTSIALIEPSLFRSQELLPVELVTTTVASEVCVRLPLVPVMFSG